MIRIGCSGWNYQHWRNGVFYPPRLPPRRWLEFYAERFDTVEINMTFYRLPRETAVANWVRESPEGFLFAVKMSRYVTHIKRLRDLPPSLELFYSRHPGRSWARRSSGRCSGSFRGPSTATTSGLPGRWRCSRPAATASSSATRAGSCPRCTSCCGRTASRS